MSTDGDNGYNEKVNITKIHLRKKDFMQQLKKFEILI